jgi:hypothetical protein
MVNLAIQPRANAGRVLPVRKHANILHIMDGIEIFALN